MPETFPAWVLFAFYTGGAACGWFALAVEFHRRIIENKAWRTHKLRRAHEACRPVIDTPEDLPADWGRD